MKKQTWITGLTLVSLFAFGFLSRIIPHPPNMTALHPITTQLGLLRHKYLSALTLLLIMGVGDFFLGFHSTLLFGYLSVLICLGLSYLVTPRTPLSQISLSLGHGLIFFVISNFGVWLVSGWYPNTLIGLGTCYLRALPFLKWTLASSFIYGSILFVFVPLVKNRCLRSTATNIDSLTSHS